MVGDFVQLREAATWEGLAEGSLQRTLDGSACKITNGKVADKRPEREWKKKGQPQML
jgi:hypothetical protein